MKKISLILIKFYQQFISPFFLPSCRFYPTCSSYALESIDKHGFFKGFFFSVIRVCKCHPWHKGGYDPVK